MSSAADATVARPVRSRIMRRARPYLLSLPALLVCIGILVPFFTAAYYSMMRYRLNLPMLKGFIWFDNYAAFLSDATFWHTVAISRIYAGLTVGLELVLGLGIALLLQKPTRFHNIASILLLLPLMTAPALAALMWKLMTNPNFGILSYLVSLLGITDFKWASDPSTALFTVTLVDVWVYTPFMMILLLAGLPRSFVFFRITLPMLMPYIITATLFRLLDSIQQFDIIYSMTQGGPGDTLLVLWAITYFLSNIFIKQWLKLRERTRGHG